MRSAYEVTNFIETNTSIKEFYNFVTIDETTFNYDINQRGNCGWTALQSACKKQNLALINALLEMGANPNTPRDNNFTPLYDAIQSGNLEAVKLLRQHGARLDSCGMDYFNLASKLRYTEIFDYLTSTLTQSEHEILNNKELQGLKAFEHQDEIEAQFKLAIKENDVEAAKKLLSENNINFSNIYFNGTDYSTRVAAMQDNLEMVKLLVKHGDFIIEPDHYSGKSTPEVAKAAGHNDIAKFLIDTQCERYQRLKAEATKQKEVIRIAKTKYYQLGLFHEKSNNLESINNQASSNIQLNKRL